jgi:hypothetical protein
VHKSGKHKIRDVTVTSKQYSNPGVRCNIKEEQTNLTTGNCTRPAQLQGWAEKRSLVCHFFLESRKLNKTSSTQSCDISPPPYIALNPHLSIIPVQCQLKEKAVRTCISNNMPLSTVVKIPPIDIHHHMQAVYGDKCVDVSIDNGYDILSKFV